MDKIIDLVIARYKEDIAWTNNLPNFLNIIVYDKFISNAANSLPNLGREGHTYLHHIINNYNSLSEINIFCQGNPLDHNSTFIQTISNVNNIIKITEQSGFYPLGPIVSEGPYANIDIRHKSGLPMFYILDLFFDYKMSIGDKYNTSYGGQFLVRKENIISRPIELYLFLYKILSYDKDPIEGYILERLWPYILNKDLKLSNKILYFISDMKDVIGVDHL